MVDSENAAGRRKIRELLCLKYIVTLNMQLPFARNVKQSDRSRILIVPQLLRSYSNAKPIFPFTRVYVIYRLHTDN